MMKKDLPSSPACQRNKTAIYHVIKDFISGGQLLEMGFGTAEHCEYFAPKFTELTWYGCDHPDYHSVFNQRVSHFDNVQGPYTLWSDQIKFRKQLQEQSIDLSFDYFYTANTLHIMSQQQVDFFCQEVGTILKEKALLFLYGPFKFAGLFTSESNQLFDESLRSRNVGSGIRDFERIEKMLADSHLYFENRFDLPANNHLLIFKKSSS